MATGLDVNKILIKQFVFYSKFKFKMRRMIISWLAVLSTALSVCNVSGYFVVVDANAEECFFDRVTAGTKMSLTFEVAEGGFLDIDVTVCVLEFTIICLAIKYS